MSNTMSETSGRTPDELIESCFDLRISSSGADIGIKFGDEPEFARVWVKYEHFLEIRKKLEALMLKERKDELNKLPRTGLVGQNGIRDDWTPYLIIQDRIKELDTQIEQLKANK